MVDSQDLKADYNEEIEVGSDEEMFPLTGNSRQTQQSNYELKDWDSQTIELFNSQTYADDASKVLRNGDFATASQGFELPFPIKTIENLAPGESLNLEVHMQQIENQPTSSTLDHLKQFPSLEVMSLPGVNFQVTLPKETSDKTSWMYSEKLGKLFVKMGNTCSFNVSLNGSPERATMVRAMLVCSNPEDLHHPVSRCDNHRCSDNLDIEDYIKTHVVRCKNEQFLYVGNKDGTVFEDRLAVVIPMGQSSKGGITLEFCCQNSCRNINRRATALVFTLEDESGRILGRQLFQIKICTNIKRDKLNEEKSAMEESIRKRKATQPLEMKRSKKIMRYHSSSGMGLLQPSASQQLIQQQQIKEETGTRRCEIDPVTVTITLPNRRMAKRTLENAIGLVSTAVVRSSSETERAELMQFIQDIRRSKTSFGLPNSQSSTVDSD